MGLQRNTKGGEPEIRAAKCPLCNGPSIAEHYPDGTIFIWTCAVCQNAVNRETKDNN